MDTKHDLVVHYGGNVHFILNVDPDRYSHIDMIDDVYQLSLINSSITNAMTMNLSCSIPESNQRMLVDSDHDILQMFEICGKYKQIDIYEEFDGAFVSFASVGFGRGSPKNFLNGYARASTLVIKKGTDVGGSSFASARGGRSANARGGRYASIIGNGFASAIGGKVSSTRGGGFVSARGGFGSAKGGLLVQVVVDLLVQWMDLVVSDEEYMCNSEEMAENHSSGNNEGNYEDEDLQDKDDGYILDYKSDDNCGAYSSDDEGFKLERDKNEKNRVTAHCGIKGCKWRIHASTLPDRVTFKIKIVGGLGVVANHLYGWMIAISMVYFGRGVISGSSGFKWEQWNNGLFPIAFGVVDSETKESWAFFLYHLHSVIDDGVNLKPWTFMTDG
ncbi:hypothetical protein F0562_022414 [Nyssa sinensis]|uniref:Transposase MuDR plant domain-containing protein n=1 Tax=Nyssa sinensis TaxID=561372 RepID=A0A5J5BRJ6_9ASTE|nr:hypothetical protein F0562_022414 [Nyssa sinensis]